MLYFFLALAVSAGISKLLIFLAPRLNFISKPTEERWAKAPIPLGGGIAILLAISPFLFGFSTLLWVSTAIVFGTGLLDDHMSLKPRQKLFFQFLATLVLFLAPAILGIELKIIGDSSLFNILVLMAFPAIIFFTNSLNFMDNMDGNTGLYSLITAVGFLALGFLQHDSKPEIVFFGLVGSILGFLIFNWPRARIYLGDAGSLTLGFLLACLGVRLAHEMAFEVGVMRALVWFSLVFALPMLDTFSVFLSRAFAGHGLLEGGKDHLTHRLLAYGLNEHRTNLALGALAVILNILAVFSIFQSSVISFTIFMLTLVVMILLGGFLAESNIYRPNVRKQMWRMKNILSKSVGLFVDVLVMLSSILLSAELVGIELIDCFPGAMLLVCCRLILFQSAGLNRGLWSTFQFRHVWPVFVFSSLASLIFVTLATIPIFSAVSIDFVVLELVFCVVLLFLCRIGIRVMRHIIGLLVPKNVIAVAIGSKAFVEMLRNSDAAKPYRITLGIHASSSKEILQEVEASQAGIAFAEENFFEKKSEEDLLQRGVLLRRVRLSVL